MSIQKEKEDGVEISIVQQKNKHTIFQFDTTKNILINKLSSQTNSD